MSGKARRLFRKINGAWLCTEIMIDFVLIVWSIALLAKIRVEFNDVLQEGGTVYVASDANYWGPLEIVCPHHGASTESVNLNCERTLQLHSSTTGTQNYFSLKYLEFLRENMPITVDDITESRHSLFIVLSVYICIWFCCSCAGKLQSHRGEGQYLGMADDDDLDMILEGGGGGGGGRGGVSASPHGSYYAAMCYLENSLATFKMMMINIFAVSEEMKGILVLEYIPGYSLVVFMVVSLVMGCALGVLQEGHRQYQNTPLKHVCLMLSIAMLLSYFALFILPSFGLNLFALQFCTEFKSVSNGMLTADFVRSVNLLKGFAFYMGFMGWIKTLTPILQMWCSRRLRQSYALLGDVQYSEYSSTKYSEYS